MGVWLWVCDICGWRGGGHWGGDGDFMQGRWAGDLVFGGEEGAMGRGDGGGEEGAILRLGCKWT